MTKQALIDKRLLPLCKQLEAGSEVFQREFSALLPDHFVPWHDTTVYSGGWLVFPLVIQIDPVPTMYDLERNRELCPESFSLLSRHPRILLASVSRLLPGCRIRTHQDLPKAGVVRFHLGLCTAESAALVFEGVEATTPRGESLVFDHSMPHSSHNLGHDVRDVLLVDFEVTAEETEALTRVRGAVNIGPTAPPC